MGLRFRRSIKIAPGLKLNLNKKSIGLTAGIRGAHFTVNSKGRKTASVGIPGTGLSYTKSYGGGKSSSSKKTLTSDNTDNNLTLENHMPEFPDDNRGEEKKWYHRTWFIILMLFFFFPVGLYLMWRRSNWPMIPKVIVSVLIALGAIFSFIPSSHPDSMVLSIPEYQDEYDINSEIPFVLSVYPEGASTSSVEYVASNSDIAISDNIITVGNEEGSFEVHAKDGTVESNSITINVVDMKAREEALAKEERIRKEAEKKAAAEAEAERLAEEQFVKEAEENSNTVTENTGAITSSQSDNTTSGNEESLNQYNTPSQQQTSETYVLNTSTMKFHKPSCKSVSKIKPENYSTSSSTRDELISQGYSPCGNCHP